MEAFINVIRKDPKVQIKINDILDNYNRSPLNYQSKMGYNCFIQNVIFREIINIMCGTIRDLDIELKMKTISIKNLEGKTNSQIFERVW